MTAHIGRRRNCSCIIELGVGPRYNVGAQGYGYITDDSYRLPGDRALKFFTASARALVTASTASNNIDQLEEYICTALRDRAIPTCQYGRQRAYDLQARSASDYSPVRPRNRPDDD